MKKKITKISLILMVFILVMGNLFCYRNVSAKANDNSQKKKVQKLCNEFRDLVGYYVFYNMKSDNVQIVFDFSKEKDRCTMMKYTYSKYGKLNKRKQNNLSKKLFGKTLSKKVTQLIGDWGCVVPMIKVSKISKIKGSKYKVKVNIYSVDDTDLKNLKYEKKAKGSFWLKKSSKAKYGYYVNKITLYK